MWCVFKHFDIARAWYSEVHNIYSDNGRYVVTLLLDFTRAFETEKKFNKFQLYSITEVGLNYRYQIAKLGNSFSKPLGTDYGVPQESVLGQLLFIILFKQYKKLYQLWTC